MLQNPRGGCESLRIACLEHINGNEPYSILWTRAHKVENAYIESFNRRFRDECLNEHWFLTMAHARRAIENWRIEYNCVSALQLIGYETVLRIGGIELPLGPLRRVLGCFQVTL